MAGTNRRSARDLIQEIAEDGSQFEFFQAVRLLALAEREIHSAGMDGSPGEERSGAAIPEALRFATPLSLAFPANDILDVRPIPAGSLAAKQAASQAPQQDGDDAQDSQVDPLALQLTIGFLGLTGPSGVLPTSYTELLIERKTVYRDTAAHQFLDLFVHRATSLFYEAWRKHRFHIGYEAGERDGFSRNLLDLVGVGLGSLQSRLDAEEGGVPDGFLSHFAGLLSQKPVSATNLKSLIGSYFDVDVEIEQFVGQWIAVPLAEQSVLGVQSMQLGESTVAGERLWDRQTKMRIQLGPLREEAYANFLPGRPGAAALAHLVQFCIGQSLACDVQLTLHKDCVPMLQLGGEVATGAQLGHSTWLRSHALHQHPSDACFALLE